MDGNGSVFIIVFLILGLIALVFFAVIKVINAKNEKIVSSHSKSLAKLAEINNATKFHDVKNHFKLFKHYDNKGHYLKIEPSYLMSSYIRDNIVFFVDYVQKVKENQETYNQYMSNVRIIQSEITEDECKQLKVSLRAYKAVEKKLFSTMVKKPVCDCKFTVKMSYSSPAGKVNLDKSASFNFADIVVSLNSVSRSSLDYETKKILNTVERGEISDSLRYDVLRMSNFRCSICGASAQEGARLHVDHIIPVSKGGKSELSNLRVLCERCNVGKSNKIEVLPENMQYISQSEKICPKCGAKLKKINGKYGEFYGCENYPHCKYTEKIV